MSYPVSLEGRFRSKIRLSVPAVTLTFCKGLSIDTWGKRKFYYTESVDKVDFVHTRILNGLMEYESKIL